MSLFLKNYTSDVPVSQTIYRIEQVLIKCGVSGIMKEYNPKGEVCALTFQIKFENSKPWVIRLPVEVQKAWDALWLNYADGEKLTADGMRLAWNNRKSKIKIDFKDQAERTAWKIVQDWVEVQMSMIQMRQADFRQVFLPYVWDGERSFYDRLQVQGFKALLPDKTDDKP